MLSNIKYIIIVFASALILPGCVTSGNSNKEIPLSSEAAVKPNRATPVVEILGSDLVTPKIPSSDHLVTPKIPGFVTSVSQHPQYTELTAEAKQCMRKYYVGYEYAICLYNNNDIKSAAEYLKGLNSNNRLVVELLQKIEHPLVYIVDIANIKLKEWLNRETELGLFALKAPAPIKANPVTLSLVKKEFETTVSFNQRVLLAQQELADKDALVEQHYQEQLNAYNQALDSYNARRNEEMQNREQRSLDVYLDYINSSVVEVLGTPSFVNPVYDADTQQMFVELTSKKAKFKQPLVVDVAIENAEAFKANLAKVFPLLRFDTTRKSLSIASVSAELDNQVYNAKLLDSDKYAASLREEVRVNINAKY